MTEKSGGLNRRQVLAGAGAVGAIGFIGGLGGARSLAQFADRESVAGNLRAGVLDLEICWEDGDEACNPLSRNVIPVPITVDEVGDTGSARIRYELPDTDRNNPGHVWFRTGCATDACGLERALSVTIWEDGNCDGEADGEELVLTQGRLCDVLSGLHDGVLLDTDRDTSEADPLEPGEQRCLGIEWELVDPVCTTDSVEVVFEFRAEQARHNPAPVSPWAGATCEVNCADTADCLECTDIQGGGISFVAFCGPQGVEEADLTLRPTAMNLDREAVAFEWQCTKPVDSVMVKLGNGNGNDRTGGEFAMYEFDAPTYITALSDGSCHGHVRSGEGTLAIDGEPWNPCADGTGLKYEIDEEAFERV